MTHTNSDNRLFIVLAVIALICVAVFGLSMAHAFVPLAVNNEPIPEDLFSRIIEHQRENVKMVTYERAYLEQSNYSYPDLENERQSFCIGVECLGISEVNPDRMVTLGGQLDKLERTKLFIMKTYATAILLDQMTNETRNYYDNALDSVNPNITNSSGFSYPQPSQMVHLK